MAYVTAAATHTHRIRCGATCVGDINGIAIGHTTTITTSTTITGTTSTRTTGTSGCGGETD